MSRSFPTRRSSDLEGRVLDAGKLSSAWNLELVVVPVALELHFLLEPVAGHIGLHLLDHRLHGRADRLLISTLRKSEYRIAQDPGWFGGIEDDARLALLRAADLFDRARGVAGELDASVWTGRGPCRG